MKDVWKRKGISERHASLEDNNAETMGILWIWTLRSRGGLHGRIGPASEEVLKPIRKETDVERKTCAIIAENPAIG